MRAGEHFTPHHFLGVKTLSVHENCKADQALTTRERKSFYINHLPNHVNAYTSEP